MPRPPALLIPATQKKTNSTSNSTSNSESKSKSRSIQNNTEENECQIPDSCAINTSTNKGFGANGIYLVCSNRNQGYKKTKKLSKKSKNAISKLSEIFQSENVNNSKNNSKSKSKQYTLKDFCILPYTNTISNCTNNTKVFNDGNKNKTQYITPHVDGIQLEKSHQLFVDRKNTHSNGNNIKKITNKDINGIKIQLNYVLDSLHTKGFYHNDIHENNIMLEWKDEIVHIKGFGSTGTHWMVKLIDFDMLTEIKDGPSHSVSADKCNEFLQIPNKNENGNTNQVNIDDDNECVNQLIYDVFYRIRPEIKPNS